MNKSYIIVLQNVYTVLTVNYFYVTYLAVKMGT